VEWLIGREGHPYQTAPTRSSPNLHGFGAGATAAEGRKLGDLRFSRIFSREAPTELRFGNFFLLKNKTRGGKIFVQTCVKQCSRSPDPCYPFDPQGCDRPRDDRNFRLTTREGLLSRG